MSTGKEPGRSGREPLGANRRPLPASRRTSIHHNRPVETLLLVNISSMIPNPMAGAQVKTGNHPDMRKRDLMAAYEPAFD
jgi:hypothetical protein